MVLQHSVQDRKIIQLVKGYAFGTVVGDVNGNGNMSFYVLAKGQEYIIWIVSVMFHPPPISLTIFFSVLLFHKFWWIHMQHASNLLVVALPPMLFKDIMSAFSTPEVDRACHVRAENSQQTKKRRRKKKGGEIQAKCDWFGAPFWFRVAGSMLCEPLECGRGGDGGGGERPDKEMALRMWSYRSPPWD